MSREQQCCGNEGLRWCDVVRPIDSVKLVYLITALPPLTQIVPEPAGRTVGDEETDCYDEFTPDLEMLQKRSVSLLLRTVEDVYCDQKDDLQSLGFSCITLQCVSQRSDANVNTVNSITQQQVLVCDPPAPIITPARQSDT